MASWASDSTREGLGRPQPYVKLFFLNQSLLASRKHVLLAEFQAELAGLAQDLFYVVYFDTQL